MKITLRKATKIRSKLETMISEQKRLAGVTIINVNPADIDGFNQVMAAQIELEAAILKAIVLSKLNVELRIMIGVANYNTKINDMLATIVANKSIIQMLKIVMQSDTTPDVDNIHSRLVTTLEMNKNASRHYGTGTEQFTTVSKTFHKRMADDIALLEEDTENLQDKVEELNIRSYIELSVAMTGVLEDEKLI